MSRRDSRVARDRADRCRVVAREHLERHPFGAEEGHRVGRVLAQALGEDDDAQREQRVRQRGVGRGWRERRAGGGERQHPPAGGGALGRARGGARRRRRSRAAPPERRARADRRPAPARSIAVATRTGPGPSAPARRAVAAELRGVHGLERRVPRRGAGREAPERPRELVLPHPFGRYQLHDPQRRLGQRPGLVRAQDRHRSERLDRVELLREHAAPRHFRRRHRHRSATPAGSAPQGRC